MSDTVNTVTGRIAIDDLGVTLMHEHVLIGYPGAEADVLNPGPSYDEMVDIAVGRIREIQDHGIQSMLDPCPIDLGRDVNLMREVASQTGFNLICATGLYFEEAGGHAYWHFRRQLDSDAVVRRMADAFVHELTVGINGTDIKAGVIKVATGLGQITEYEHDVFRAAALASRETGAPITTHTELGTMGDAQQEFLLEHGVDAHKIIIGHSCGSTDNEYHTRILNNGSYLGFDRFGLEVLMPDEDRINSLVALLEAGKVRQIVLSHDSVWCTRGVPFPEELVAMYDPGVAFNPTHFHRNILPQLLERGVTQDQIDEMLVENPKRYFSGVSPN